MNLGIVGSRDFNDYWMLASYVDKLVEEYGITSIVSGGAKGADTLARTYAEANGLELIEYLAEWDRYGKSAGFKRNELIWKDSDVIIAFWDGESKGTKHTIDKYKGDLFVINYNEEPDEW